MNIEKWLPRIEFPELFFGFVAPIGAEIDSTLVAFRDYFHALDYKIVEIKVTDLFPVLARYVPPKDALDRSSELSRYRSFIAYGDELRDRFGDAILAASIINRIVKRRLRLPQPKEPFSKTVYLLHQFKRKEEIDLLRSVYGRLFFQVSIYSRRGARIDELARKFSTRRGISSLRNPRAEAEEIVHIDSDEADNPHGQQVSKIFHDADVIVGLDSNHATVSAQVTRFCELIFGSNRVSPTTLEYGMFCAKAAALSSLDLSRQVGAAIFDHTGHVLCMGANEVPKALGGNYSCDDPFDDREYARGGDSNEEHKRHNLAEIAALLGIDRPIDELLADEKIKDARVMDVLEYGRVVHAEMTAITDAARLGRSLAGATLYCTTFPCHLCAKHIVSAGIKRVVFLEPYPKSLASELHADAISVEGSDRGRYQDYPSVDFHHFFGVTPRRYRELFERGKRKSSKGQFLAFSATGNPRPIIDIKFPFYAELEGIIVGQTAKGWLDAINLEDDLASRGAGA